MKEKSRLLHTILIADGTPNKNSNKYYLDEVHIPTDLVQVMGSNKKLGTAYCSKKGREIIADIIFNSHVDPHLLHNLAIIPNGYIEQIEEDGTIRNFNLISIDIGAWSVADERIKRINVSKISNRPVV